jgi:hypothetical protein
VVSRSWHGPKPNGAQPWQTLMRTIDVCECKQERVHALEDEIHHLTVALESREVPVPRNQANGRQVREQT